MSATDTAIRDADTAGDESGEPEVRRTVAAVKVTKSHERGSNPTVREGADRVVKRCRKSQKSEA